MEVFSYMRKKALISAAVAVMLVAAFAAVAFAAGVSVSGPSSISTGETIQITVTGAGEGASGSVSTSGLDVVSVSGAPLSDTSNFVVADALGGLSATYNCTVTAGAGETASFTVSGVTISNGTQDEPGDGGSWSATVAGGTEPTQEPSTQPTGDASAQPSGSAGASASAGSSSSVKPGTSAKPGTTDNMPKTGDATMDLWTLAIIAAACAAVAVVAGKKVFSHK